MRKFPDVVTADATTYRTVRERGWFAMMMAADRKIEADCSQTICVRAFREIRRDVESGSDYGLSEPLSQLCREYLQELGDA